MYAVSVNSKIVTARLAELGFFQASCFVYINLKNKWVLHMCYIVKHHWAYGESYTQFQYLWNAVQVIDTPKGYVCKFNPI